MSRSFSVSCLWLVSTFALGGCPAKGGEGSSSAGPPGEKVARTCKDAGGRYGEHFAKTLMADPQNPVPPALRDETRGAIQEAIVQSCEEDKWDSVPLDCLAAIFEKPGVIPDKDLGKALDICAGGAGKDKTAKMDERVARAIADAGRDKSAPAAPWVSKTGGFQIDFRGKVPDESTKNDPNGGTWYEASLANGAMVQYADYANDAQAAAEVKVFLPTRDKEKIKRDEPVSFQGLVGRDIEMTLSSSKVFWIRFLIDGKRVFKLGAVYSGDNTDAKAFVESFKRIKS